MRAVPRLPSTKTLPSSDRATAHKRAQQQLILADPNVWALARTPAPAEMRIHMAVNIYRLSAIVDRHGAATVVRTLMRAANIPSCDAQRPASCQRSAMTLRRRGAMNSRRKARGGALCIVWRAVLEDTEVKGH